VVTCLLKCIDRIERVFDACSMELLFALMVICVGINIAIATTMY